MYDDEGGNVVRACECVLWGYFSIIGLSQLYTFQPLWGGQRSQSGAHSPAAYVDFKDISEGQIPPLSGSEFCYSNQRVVSVFVCSLHLNEWI